MALTETWKITAPTISNNYNCVHLAALPATNNRGRNIRGIDVFIKKSLRISGIRMERTSFGEFVSFIVNDNVCVVVFYRDSGQRTMADY